MLNENLMSSGLNGSSHGVGAMHVARLNQVKTVIQIDNFHIYLVCFKVLFPKRDRDWVIFESSVRLCTK